MESLQGWPCHLADLIIQLSKPTQKYLLPFAERVFAGLAKCVERARGEEQQQQNRARSCRAEKSNPVQH